MKKYIYLLLVGLFSGQLTILAQQPAEESTVVEIQSDTTIIVRDIIKEDNGDICISFKYNEDTLKIFFYGVKYDNVLTQRIDSIGEHHMDSNERYYDKTVIYCINVTKKSDVESKEKKANNKGRHIGLQNEISAEMLGIALVILIIICLIIVILIRINRLNERIDRCEVNKQPSRKSEDIGIDKIRQVVISGIKSTDLVQRISNDDIYNLIKRSDIQQYIQSVIVGRAEEYLRNRVNVSTPPVVETPVQSTDIAQPALRTTKIEYKSDNNSFIISENSSNKIFEIYSSNGEYYYTIVNDSSIKKEMLGFITAFAKCVETRQDSLIPSTVEVIRDGHLNKNEDRYIVDANCLLQVSLS